ncbi:MAG: RNA-binding protein [Spirochaetes bacterium GWF1_31_7]|nr:MAG: RNA-binding protein [Spirochaetes bacterium GWE1_32_154]OHD47404.1 MAG: RNA-binding protein [Spirochaetes bacterium GWE2_31_10]OHD52929.1 MAG: RNA-binding protein [Spirochaetes bacterium GWF1_31_7]OHD79518.1 MAG: RNA-binding protein [Spirochaetes bacterium RIFOXYB1_FULL_32_8]HBD95751.1 RNA-binding protein [Spirochaetia bacterium]
MSKKIYVGNMNYGTDEQELNEIFGEFGSVASAKIIMDQFTGRSKGFAFVEMENEEDAMAAINALNGKEIGGRVLKVNEALDRAKPSNGGGDRGGFRRNNNNRY